MPVPRGTPVFHQHEPRQGLLPPVADLWGVGFERHEWHTCTIRPPLGTIAPVIRSALDPGVSPDSPGLSGKMPSH